MENVMTMGSFCEMNENEMMETDGGNAWTDFWEDFGAGLAALNDKKYWGKADAAANQFIMQYPNSPTALLYAEKPRG